MRWILFVAIGIVTALVACFVDVLIETFSDLKFECLQKCKSNPSIHCSCLSSITSFRLFQWSTDSLAIRCTSRIWRGCC